MRNAFALAALLLVAVPAWAETWIICSNRAPATGRSPATSAPAQFGVASRLAFTVREVGGQWGLYQAGSATLTPARIGGTQSNGLTVEIVNGTNAHGEVGIRFDIDPYVGKAETVATIRSLSEASGIEILGMVHCSVERY